MVVVTIDLITGFLGSGKTTFIKKYAKYFMDRGLKVGILENDFGAINVDMLLLHDLLGDNCQLEMLAGGCDRETHSRRFRTKLIAMGMCGYDRVLVEPSGIYDVDEFFDVLREEPLDGWYQIGNVIAIVDSNLEDTLSVESDYLLASEVANAGTVILSHGDNTDEKQVERTISHLNHSLEQIRCDRRLEEQEVKVVDLPHITEQELEQISKCGYRLEHYQKLDIGDHKGYDSLYFMNEKMTEENLRERAEKILRDSSCGQVFRIKGFLQKQDGSWITLNATRRETTVQPIAVGQEVLIVIGEHLDEERIKSILTFPG